MADRPLLTSVAQVGDAGSWSAPMSSIGESPICKPASFLCLPRTRPQPAWVCHSPVPSPLQGTSIPNPCCPWVLAQCQLSLPAPLPRDIFALMPGHHGASQPGLQGSRSHSSPRTTPPCAPLDGGCEQLPCWAGNPHPRAQSNYHLVALRDRTGAERGSSRAELLSTQYPR